MQNGELKSILLKTRPFQYLEPNELEILIAYCEIITFPDEKILVQQGKKSNGMYIIISGIALSSAKSPNKETLHLATLTQGDFIGEMSLIEKGPSTTSVIAKGELRCLLITTTYFEMLSLFYPEIKYKISKAITETVCERLKLIYNNIINFMKKSDIATMSLYSSVIKSFIKPEKISYADAKIDPQLLKARRPFNVFNEEEFNELLKHAELVHTDKNCDLIKEHEKDPPYFILIRGAVLSSIIQHNKVAKLSVLGPMHLFGSPAYIDNNQSLVAYTTCEKAILLEIRSASLELLQKEHIHLWYKLYSLICESFVLLEKTADKLQIRLNSELYNV